MAEPKHHLDELLKLPAEARSRAAEVLLESLEASEPEPGLEEAWAEELQRRVAENAPGLPADQVFAELRARYQDTP